MTANAFNRDQADHQPASEEEGSGYASPAVDLTAALILIAFSLWYIIEALGFRVPGDWQTAPALVPIAAGASLLAMAIGLGVSAWRRRGKAMTDPHDGDLAHEETDVDPVRTGLIIAITLAYVGALQFLSMPVSMVIADRFIEVGVFEVATILTLCSLMRLFWGGPLWAILAIAVAWTLTLSLTFRLVFFISLPV